MKQTKVAVVTGGSGVLGQSMCKALVNNGYKVAILGRDLAKASKVADELAKDEKIAIAISCDVTNKASVINAAKEVQDKLGGCDLLVNAAGGNHPLGTSSLEYYEEDVAVGQTSFFNLDEVGIDFVFKLNFMGTLLPSQVFAKQMLGKSDASIINISSMSALCPLTKIPAYSAAKAAVNNFTSWLAVHLAKSKIRVNAIAPGFFLTEQNYKLLKNEDGSLTPRAQKIIAHTPMERFGEADELVGTLLWLSNQQASGFVNGVVIPVDGGFSAYAGV